MAKFSVGREEDDNEGPSSPRPKKQRTTLDRPQQEQQVVEDEEVIVESEHDEEDDERESEYDEEVEEEDEDDRNGSQATTVRPTSNCVPCEDDRSSAGPSGDCSISLTLTDPDVLDCPICLEPLSSPVFQCENGHVACSSCCSKLGNKCPSCSWPIGYNRCRALEKVIESVKISCENLKYGCKRTLSYSRKHFHLKLCAYEPCLCPLSDCAFIGSAKQLYPHFNSCHTHSSKRFVFDCLIPVNLGVGQKFLILQEESVGLIFILNRGIEVLGNTVNVTCIGPCVLKRGFSYDVIARSGESCLRLQSFTKVAPRWVEHSPVEKFLLVPSGFVGSNGPLNLELCIRRHHKVPAPV